MPQINNGYVDGQGSKQTGERTASGWGLSRPTADRADFTGGKEPRRADTERAEVWLWGRWLRGSFEERRIGGNSPRVRIVLRRERRERGRGGKERMTGWGRDERADITVKGRGGKHAIMLHLVVSLILSSLFVYSFILCEASTAELKVK